MNRPNRSSANINARRHTVGQPPRPPMGGRPRWFALKVFLAPILRLSLLLGALALLIAGVVWLGGGLIGQVQSWFAPAMPQLTHDTVLIDANHHLSEADYNELSQTIQTANAQDGLQRLVIINNRTPAASETIAENLWPPESLKTLDASMLKPMGTRLLVLWINPSAKGKPGAVRLIAGKDLAPYLFARPQTSFTAATPLFLPSRLEPSRWDALTQTYYPLLLQVEPLPLAVKDMLAGLQFLFLPDGELEQNP
jgi:hypothetical protein